MKKALKKHGPISVLAGLLAALFVFAMLFTGSELSTNSNQTFYLHSIPDSYLYTLDNNKLVERYRIDMLGTCYLNGKVCFAAKTKKADLVSLTQGGYVISTVPIQEFESQIKWETWDEYIESYEELQRYREFDLWCSPKKQFSEDLEEYPTKIAGLFEFKNMKGLRAYLEDESIYAESIGFNLYLGEKK